MICLTLAQSDKRAINESDEFRKTRGCKKRPPIVDSRTRRRHPSGTSTSPACQSQFLQRCGGRSMQCRDTPTSPSRAATTPSATQSGQNTPPPQSKHVDSAEL
eukprot:scaffold23012_cov75-Phaeocystis_antarctica.AAC.1